MNTVLDVAGGLQEELGPVGREGREHVDIVERLLLPIPAGVHEHAAGSATLPYAQHQVAAPRVAAGVLQLLQRRLQVVGEEAEVWVIAPGLDVELRRCEQLACGTGSSSSYN